MKKSLATFEDLLQASKIPFVDDPEFYSYFPSPKSKLTFQECLTYLANRKMIEAAPYLSIASGGKLLAKEVFEELTKDHSLELNLSALYFLRLGTEVELAEQKVIVYHLSDLADIYVSRNKKLSERTKILNFPLETLAVLGGLETMNQGIEKNYLQSLENGALIGFTDKLKL